MNAVAIVKPISSDRYLVSAAKDYDLIAFMDGLTPEIVVIDSMGTETTRLAVAAARPDQSLAIVRVKDRALEVIYSDNISQSHKGARGAPS